MNELEMKRFTKQFLNYFVFWNEKYAISPNGCCQELAGFQNRDAQSVILMVISDMTGDKDCSLKICFVQNQDECIKGFKDIMCDVRNIWKGIDSGSLFFTSEYDSHGQLLYKINKRTGIDLFSTPYREEKDVAFFEKLNLHKLNGTYSSYLDVDLESRIEKIVSEQKYLPSIKDILLQTFVVSRPVLPESDCLDFEFKAIFKPTSFWIKQKNLYEQCYLNPDMHQIDEYKRQAKYEILSIKRLIMEDKCGFVVETNYKGRGFIFTLAEKKELSKIAEQYRR